MVNDNFWNDGDFRTIMKLIVVVLCVIAVMIAVSIVFPSTSSSIDTTPQESVIESLEQSNDDINEDIEEQESQIEDIDADVESLEHTRANQRDSYKSFRYKKSADESVVDLDRNLNSIRHETTTNPDNDSDQ